MNIKSYLYILFIISLTPLNIYAKKITFESISLELPEDIYLNKKIGPDFEVYYFYK